MKKKVLSLFIFILFIFLCSGCSQSEQTFLADDSITFAIEIKSEGRISQTISFPSQEGEMSLSEEARKHYLSSLEKEIKLKLYFPYFYNFYTISAIATKPEYKMGTDGMTYSQPAYDEKTRTISFSFHFSNEGVWDFYHPSNEGDKGLGVETGIFLNKAKSQGDFLFGQKLSTGEKLGEHFCTILSTVQAEYSDNEIPKPSLSYKYSHFSNKLHTNADYHENSNGQNIHIWTQEYSLLGEEKNVEIYVYSPNRAVWYALALGGTLLGAVLAILIYKFKEK